MESVSLDVAIQKEPKGNNSMTDQTQNFNGDFFTNKDEAIFALIDCVHLLTDALITNKVITHEKFIDDLNGKISNNEEHGRDDAVTVLILLRRVLKEESELRMLLDEAPKGEG